MSHLILFICTGNICRSPMAQVLFNARARREHEEKEYYAESAGTWANGNQPASSHAIITMAKRGFDLSQHTGRTVTHELLAQASVVIVMTRNHFDALCAEFPQYRPKYHLISELKDRLYDIQDPYGGPLDGYEQCATQLAELIESGYPKIKKWANANCPNDH